MNMTIFQISLINYVSNTLQIITQKDVMSELPKKKLVKNLYSKV